MYVLYILLYIPIHAMAYTRKEGGGKKSNRKKIKGTKYAYLNYIFKEWNRLRML